MIKDGATTLVLTRVLSFLFWGSGTGAQFILWASYPVDREYIGCVSECGQLFETVSTIPGLGDNGPRVLPFYLRLLW